MNGVTLEGDSQLTTARFLGRRQDVAPPRSECDASIRAAFDAELNAPTDEPTGGFV
jgi:hypothetical protein